VDEGTQPPDHHHQGVCAGGKAKLQTQIWGILDFNLVMRICKQFCFYFIDDQIKEEVNNSGEERINDSDPLHNYKCHSNNVTRKRLTKKIINEYYKLSST